MISAIITTYKRQPNILKRALESVLNQTYPDLEIIVVDDSPADFPERDSIAEMIVQESIIYRKEIKYIRHETTMGACAARNTGLHAAKGEFIAYLDDDDEWLPQKLERQIARFSKGIALVFCGSITKDDETQESVVKKTQFYRGFVYDQLISGDNFIGSTSFPLLRTEALRKIGGFDTFLKSAQDYDVWLRISAEYQIDYLEEPLVIYHRHKGEQITKNPEYKLSGLRRIAEKNATYLMSHPKAYWCQYMCLVPLYTLCRMQKKAFAVSIP